MIDKLREFCEFEKDKNLFLRTYLGIPYWQSIRVIFLSSAILEKKIYSKPRSFFRFLPFGLKLCKDFVSDIFKYIFLIKCDILYFDECVYRIIDGVTVDSYFDYFEFDKEYRVQRCFHTYSHQDKTSFKGIGTAIPKVVDYLLALCSKMRIGNYRDKTEDRFIERLTEELEKEFHIGFTSVEIVQMVRRTVVIHRVYEKYYEKLLEKCRPKAIFVVAYYGSCLFPLYNLARKYSIPVIELQHGLIVEHGAYWFGDTGNVGKELPSYLFSYGAFWKTYINLPSCMQVIPIGNPFLENRKAKYENCVQDEKMMVFYSSEPAQKKMEQLAIDSLKYFGSRGYKIFFKIHPLEYDNWKEQYKLLINFPEIEIVTPDKDLYELLSCAKHHITFASTVFYEAIIFNNNRYVYDLGNLSESMQPLIEFKMAYKFKTIEELDGLLDLSMGSISKDGLEFWKEGAKGNGLKKLKEIMDG